MQRNNNNLNNQQNHLLPITSVGQYGSKIINPEKPGMQFILNKLNGKAYPLGLLHS